MLSAHGIVKEEAVLSKKEKLIQHLKTRPKDFTFEEAETLLRYFGR